MLWLCCEEMYSTTAGSMIPRKCIADPIFSTIKTLNKCLLVHQILLTSGVLNCILNVLGFFSPSACRLPVGTVRGWSAHLHKICPESKWTGCTLAVWHVSHICGLSSHAALKHAMTHSVCCKLPQKIKWWNGKCMTWLWIWYLSHRFKQILNSVTIRAKTAAFRGYFSIQFEQIFCSNCDFSEYLV